MQTPKCGIELTRETAHRIIDALPDEKLKWLKGKGLHLLNHDIAETEELIAEQWSNRK